MAKIKDKFKKALDSYIKWSSSNPVLRKIVVFQHRRFPIPLPLFDLIFRSRIFRNLLRFYGLIIFDEEYGKRQSKYKYWLSRESLYWHFWRQGDIDESLNEVFSNPQILAQINNNNLTAVELGFGTGKWYSNFLRNNNLKKYIAVELNRFACEYSRKRFGHKKNFRVMNISVEDFMKQNLKYDVLFIFGGVLMYLNKKFMRTFFNRVKRSGVQMIVVGEGHRGSDIYRRDDTAMYSFKKRILSAGYKRKHFLEKVKAGQMYRYFVMY